jgi:hypothetical protein
MSVLLIFYFSAKPMMARRRDEDSANARQGEGNKASIAFCAEIIE